MAMVTEPTYDERVHAAAMAMCLNRNEAHRKRGEISETAQTIESEVVTDPAPCDMCSLAVGQIIGWFLGESRVVVEVQSPDEPLLLRVGQIQIAYHLYPGMDSEEGRAGGWLAPARYRLVREPGA